MSKSKEEILESLLSHIDSKYDKRVGSLVYDLLAAESIEKELLYEKIKILESKLDVRNLKGNEIDLYVSQNSDLTRHPETYSKVTLEVMGSGVAYVGDLFETQSGIQFKCIEEKLISDLGEVLAESVLPGTIGNVMEELINQIPITLQGIVSVRNPLAASGGYEAEQDKSFIDRFLSTQQEEVTQGNKASYKVWCSEVKGVGDCRVFPLQNAEGVPAENSTQIVIIDSGNGPAALELVNEVQAYINPLDYNGHGEGKAPLGAYVYVKAATALVVNISVTLSYKIGYSKEIVEPSLVASLDQYIKSIAFKEDSLSLAKVSNVVFTTEGVDDYVNLKLNGQSSNISIDEKSVVVLGVVTVDGVV